MAVKFRENYLPRAKYYCIHIVNTRIVFPFKTKYVNLKDTGFPKKKKKKALIKADFRFNKQKQVKHS